MFSHHRIYFLPIYVLLLLLFLVIPVSAVNLVVNGDFESGYTGWNVGTAGSFGGTYTHSIVNSSDYMSLSQPNEHATFEIWISQSVDLTDISELKFNLTSNLYGAADSAAYFYVAIDAIPIVSTSDPDMIFDTVSDYTGQTVCLDVSSYTGVCTLYFVTGISSYYDGSNSGYVYLDSVIADDGSSPSADGELYIGGSASDQSWYVNQTEWPDLDIYFQEIVDYQIDLFNVSHDYYINCTSSNASHPYTYNYFIDDDNSLDNSIYSRMGMETKILYLDSPTTYTFHLYEINEDIDDSFPWYYWLLYPLYMLVDMFADDPGVMITELDTIAITLSKVSGDNETVPDIPEEPEEPDIPDPEPDPEPESDPEPDPEPPDPDDPAGNHTVNVTFTDGYYQLVNNTVDGFFSPVYNFTNWSCSPMTSLSSTISGFSSDLEGGFDFADSKIGLVSGAFSCVFAAFPPKIISMISFFLVLMVLLVILGRS